MSASHPRARIQLKCYEVGGLGGAAAAAPAKGKGKGAAPEPASSVPDISGKPTTETKSAEGLGCVTIVGLGVSDATLLECVVEELSAEELGMPTRPSRAPPSEQEPEAAEQDAEASIELLMVMVEVSIAPVASGRTATQSQ